jgi:negative regulator of genetic competence, sporulation and motility
LGKIVAQISADADKADDPDADEADDDMDAQGFLNMFTNVNSDGDLGREFDQESDNDSTAAKCPYPELIPTFVSITDLVQTADDLAFVRKEMNEIYSVLLSRKHKAGPAGNMASLPEVDQ